jgi:acyl carrier protein
MLASRRGQIEEALQSELDQLRESGVTVLVEALDVRDQSAVNKVTRRLSRDHGPLRGVVHAAAQLDDGLIAGLQGDRLRAVLGAKIQGALNLESATAGEDLDFFVVYSSATTMVGSPGQGAYVAANAFLEGFAQRRRAAGEPALAIGWGAIADVGLIARDRRLAERLKRSTGVVGVKASEALSHLGRLLALGNRIEPIQFYAMIAPASGASRLALLKSPAFASLDLARESSGIEDLDSLESALRDKSRVEAHAIMLKALQREAGRILRMPQDQIDPQRALSDLGFDSLMMLELTISVERVTGQQFRIVGEGERTLAAFANLILNEMAVDLDDAPEADASSASGTQSPPSAPVWTGHHEPPQMESLKRPAEMDAKG